MSEQPAPYDPGDAPTQPQYQQAPYPQQPPAPYPYGPNPPIHPHSGQHYPAQHQPGHYAPGPYPYAPMQHVAPKSPALALLVSFFIPGLGSMINGDVGKGIGILVGYVVSFFLMIVVIGFFGVLGFWIWGMVDAYHGAQRWNLRHGIVS